MTPEKLEQWLAEIAEAARLNQQLSASRRQLAGAYRPPLSADVVAKMRHMRREGFTIGEIARDVRCSWRTAWSRTKGAE